MPGLGGTGHMLERGCIRRQCIGDNVILYGRLHLVCGNGGVMTMPLVPKPKEQGASGKRKLVERRSELGLLCLFPT
jgi:hypothetical protein